MSNFLKLVSVENMKLWKRLSTKIMIIILIVIVVGACGIFKAVQSATNIEIGVTNGTTQSAAQSQALGADWKQQLTVENTGLQQSVDAMEKSSNLSGKAGIDTMKMQIAENKYRIKNNMKPDTSGKKGYWDIVMEMGLAAIITLFAVIACTGLVAGEFSEGTMKTMISRPFKRWQILTSKLVIAFSYLIILSVISFFVVMASVAIFFGTNGFNAVHLLWIGGNVFKVSAGVAAIINAGFDFLGAIVFLIIAFMLSAIFRSRALATGVSIFLTFMGSIAEILGVYFSWGKLILFADTGFANFLTGAPFYGITLGLALIISAIYCAVFLFAGYFTFAKRDIS